jgi:hypothetical protein
VVLPAISTPVPWHRSYPIVVLPVVLTSLSAVLSALSAPVPWHRSCPIVVSPVVLTSLSAVVSVVVVVFFAVVVALAAMLVLPSSVVSTMLLPSKLRAKEGVDNIRSDHCNANCSDRHL